MGHFSILLVLLPLNICTSKTMGVKNYSRSRDLHWQQDHRTQLHSEIGRQPVNKERKNCAPNPLLKNLCNDYRCISFSKSNVPNFRAFIMEVENLSKNVVKGYNFIQLLYFNVKMSFCI